MSIDIKWVSWHVGSSFIKSLSALHSKQLLVGTTTEFPAQVHCFKHSQILSWNVFKVKSRWSLRLQSTVTTQRSDSQKSV